jgi:ABC-2 type transport system permease protein
MSAIALPSAPATDDRRRPGFGRLTAVELRKMVDTRAGFWLPLGVAAVTVVTVLITLLTNGDRAHTLGHVFGNAVLPSTYLLPVIGVLLITSEFSQRTALTTFTLVPHRSRVLATKIAASLVVSAGALVIALLVAALGVAVASGSWSFSAVLIPQALIHLAIGMLTGVAFGAAILVSAPAIVAYLLLPTVWGVLSNNIHVLRSAGHWLNSSETLNPLVRHALSGTSWLHVLATVAVWMAVPMAIGTWRLLRRDVG